MIKDSSCSSAKPCWQAAAPHGVLDTAEACHLGKSEACRSKAKCRMSHNICGLLHVQVSFALAKAALEAAAKRGTKRKAGGEAASSEPVGAIVCSGGQGKLCPAQMCF